MRRKIAVINFTDVYFNESFYKGHKAHIVNLDKLREDKCICSEESFNIIRERLKSIPVDAIHFIDSGNYHYVSKAFAERIPEDFILMVFDHHADMQEDEFRDTLTCGNWIAKIKNPHMKGVILVGPEEKREGVLDISEEEVETDSFDCQKLNSDYPVYISIDKDILSSDAVHTDWDQGRMSEEILQKAVDTVLDNDKVIGVDISGEIPKDDKNPGNLKKDDELNLEIENDLLKHSLQ